MPKMIVSIDGVVIKEVQLTKERTTLGRRPYNDLVIDNLAVSGEHAAFVLEGNTALVEDLNSTNGTYVNGKAIRRQALAHGDLVEIGKYKIRFVGEGQELSGAAPIAAPTATPAASPAPVGDPPSASIEVLSGPAAGRTVPVVKVVTTLGKPGVAVASITRRHHGHALALVEGQVAPTLNGHPVGDEPVMLKDGDVIELAGTRMCFRQP
ncbi:MULTISPECIES: FHA domain-containing protein [Hydrogenophaga]|uniref:FHA domain-containing protein n=2 Tax=Hydrogenophaga TaxID=47420 RepID=A0ABW2QE23_9BURK